MHVLQITKAHGKCVLETFCRPWSKMGFSKHLNKSGLKNISKLVEIILLFPSTYLRLKISKKKLFSALHKYSTIWESINLDKVGSVRSVPTVDCPKTVVARYYISVLKWGIAVFITILMPEVFCTNVCCMTAHVQIGHIANDLRLTMRLANHCLTERSWQSHHQASHCWEDHNWSI